MRSFQNTNPLITLDQLSFGEEYEIIALGGKGEIKQRLLDMGFIPGARGRRLHQGILKDPIEIGIGQYKVSLRQSEAQKIYVISLRNSFTHDTSSMLEKSQRAKDYLSKLSSQDVQAEVMSGRRRWSGFFDPSPKAVIFENRKRRRGMGRDHEDKFLRIALAGNPNTGKSTLYNALTGAHEHVGNYAGVTVDTKKSRIRYKDWTIEFIDLPGIYSLSAYSFEEVVSRDFILLQKPDLVIDVIDATNLERNFYLCLQFQELGVPMVGALNMIDEADKKGISIDTEQLSNLLQIPFVKVSAVKREGLENLLSKSIEVILSNRSISSRSSQFEINGENGNGNDKERYHAALTEPRGRHTNYGEAIEKAHAALIDILKKDRKFAAKYSLHWVAIKLLEKDKDAHLKVENNHRFSAEVLSAAQRIRKELEQEFIVDSSTLVAQQRYGFIRGAMQEAVMSPRSSDRPSLTDMLDRFALHRVAGIFVFFAMMFLIYNLTFLIGNFISDYIDLMFASLASLLRDVLPPGIFSDLLVDGVIGGVGGVLVFLPIILLLFAFLSFLEDTGYMARAAFVMDKLMHRFGLHGRSFIPMMISTGCAVPAIMATRTLANHRDRIITAIVSPMMMCSAKSPVIAMLMAAFFPAWAGTMFWGLWLISWLVSLISALILSKTVFQGQSTPFVMELPPYRMPTIYGVLRHMWDKAIGYLKKAGTIILAASVITWIFFNFPRKTEFSKDFDGQVSALEREIQKKSDNLDSLKDVKDKERAQNKIAKLKEQAKHLENGKNQESLQYSMGARLGKQLEPLFAPLGMDWKMVVSLIAAMPAKEVALSTFGVLYGVDAEDAEDPNSLSLVSAMRNDKNYSAATVMAFAVFLLLYIPCFATLAVIKKEFDGWRWVIFSVLFSVMIAYIFSLFVYQSFQLFA